MPQSNEEQQVILTLERDPEKHGFTIIASIKNEREETLTQLLGHLPDCPDLFDRFYNWRCELQNFAGFLEQKFEAITLNSDLSIEDLLDEEEKTVEQVEKQYKNTEKKWIELFHQWLEFLGFKKILIELNNKIPNSLNQPQVRVIIETDCTEIKQLPWERWNWLTDNRRGRIILRHRNSPIISTKRSHQLSVQIILGNANNAQNEQELQRLEDYFQNFNILPPLKHPNREQVFDCIENQKFHILYFGGHGKTEEDIGKIYINESEYIEINDLVFPLREAIQKGLRLTVFKCCQGISLENNLTANKIYIPNLIVTRDIIHEEAAKQFISNFLDSFIKDKIPLHIAFDRARHNLRKSQYPGSSLMPLLFQVSEKPQYWDDWVDSSTPQSLTQPPETISPLLSSVDNAAAIAPTEQISLKPRETVVQKLGRIAIVSFVVTFLVMGVRLVGILQPFELDALYFLMKLRPKEPIDDRILIVIATPEDIATQEEKPKQRNSSLSDATLAKLFNKLEQYEPKVIGLDIYRDFKVDKEHPELITYFQKDNIIGICKRASSKDGFPQGIAHPPEISVVGFSDFVRDDDGVLRRHLFSLVEPQSTELCHPPYEKNSYSPASYSFNFWVFYLYLLKTYKTVEWRNVKNSDKNLLISVQDKSLKKSIIIRALNPYSGGYNRVDSGNGQIFINYRFVQFSRYSESIRPQYLKEEPLKSLIVAETISLSDILENKVSESKINNLKGRIILIGIVKEELGDYWRTPFYHQEIPGVLMQAQMISNFLSSLLDNRAFIWYLPEWGEWLWIFSWAAIVGLLVDRIHSSFNILIGLTVLAVLLLSCSYGLILIGGWLPIIPSLLASTLMPSGVKHIKKINQK